MHYIHSLNKEFQIEEEFNFKSEETLKEALKTLSEAGYILRVVFAPKTKLSNAKSFALSVSGVSEPDLYKAKSLQEVSGVIFHAHN